MNKSKLIQLRSNLAGVMRHFFYTENFLEVQTPLLVQNPGLEPHLKYFETRFIADMGGKLHKDKTFYLPTSPEYGIKKILGQMQHPARVFELAKAFRNGEISKTHQPEFNMLEFYATQCSLKELSDLTFRLFSTLAQSLNSPSTWNERQDFDIETLFEEFADTNFNKLRSEHGEQFSDQFHLIFLNEIEPRLRDIPGQVYLWNYPIEESMLAKPCPNDPHKAHRFEVFFSGTELGNAFDELLEKKALEQRCFGHREQRLAIYGSSPMIDQDFIQACQAIDAHTCAGIAIGWDRLIMKLLELDQLEAILPLPHM